MTIPDFISYLDQQPWKFEYIQNVLTCERRGNPTIDNFIGGTFSWTDTPQGHKFWQNLRAEALTANKSDKISDLLSAIRTHYSPTNPEFFI